MTRFEKRIDLRKPMPSDDIVAVEIVRGPRSGRDGRRPMGNCMWVCDHRGCASVCVKVGGHARPYHCTYAEYETVWRKLE